VAGEPPEKPAPAAKPAARPQPPRTARSLISQAKRLRDRGKAQQALDLFGQAVELEPRSAEAQAGRGWCYLELSQYAPAEASFQAALDLDGKSADALLGLAETFRYEGRRAEAVRYYERYLQAHPDGEDAPAAQNAIRSLKE
jgi:tetratricopeptide (TPR) repeat protein